MQDWADFLDVANDLLVHVGGEGAERTAISRAYYACSGKACAYARSKNVALANRGSDRQTVWQWAKYGHGQGAIHAGVSQNGQRLQRWRIKADYQAGFAAASTTAPKALTTDRTLLTELTHLS